MKVWFQEPDGTAKSTLKRSQEMVNSIVFFSLHDKCGYTVC
jgi:hypothetical protein